MSNSLVAFSLGPVQTFIESARSVRDLWSGSYLLSWLTYHAIRPILIENENQPDCLIFPSLKQHPLWLSDPDCCPRPGRIELDDLGKLLSPCLPNRFLANVSLAEDEARNLAARCENACRREWESICEETYDKIGAKLSASWRDQFKRSLWDAQTQTFFEIQTVVLPFVRQDAATIQKWLGETTRNQDDPTNEWLQNWRLMQSLFATTRTVRHVPEYGPITDDRVTTKCSILGTYEQMGPSGLRESADFWNDFSGSADHSGVNLDGIGLRSGERFCAISLVKRFALATALTPRIRERSNATRTDIARVVRYPDTHTVAAAKWLGKSTQLQDDFVLDPAMKSAWNGQWLHWERRDQDKADVCPADIWKDIQRKKSLPGKGSVPIYYAVLMLDGDKLGDRLRTATQLKQAQMSALMTEFALNIARKHVEEAFGVLIYCGGDDVLALLPVATALDCADNLREAFSVLWPSCGFEQVTASVGLSLVHAKEDLRLALSYARGAEKLAKNSGRNCLTLKTCRGSGEHSTAVLSWEFVPTLNGWVAKFLTEASDRWTYRLMAEMETWSSFDNEKVLQDELRRQVARSDDETQAAFLSVPTIADDFRFFCELAKERTRENSRSPAPSVGELFRRFVTLIQAAAFIARGRDR